jgi:hypothetical protein
MEELQKKLLEIQDLMKKIPMMPSPKAPQAPKMPSISPQAKKNPIKQAQQIEDPAFKKLAVKQAKATTKIAPNGQWSLGKMEDDDDVAKNVAAFIAP